MSTSIDKRGGDDFADDEVMASHFDSGSNRSSAGLEDDLSESGFLPNKHDGQDGNDFVAHTADGGNDYEAASQSDIYTGEDGGNDDDASAVRSKTSHPPVNETTRGKEPPEEGSGAWQPASMDIEYEIASSRRDEPLRDSGSSFVAKPTPFRNQKQDDFVKNGARVKALLTSALKAVADGFTSNVTADSRSNDGGKMESGANDDENGAPTQRTWRAKADFAHVQDVAREKAEECMALKRKLEESRSQIEVLQSDNADTEGTNSQLNAKIDRTIEALQIAGTNAANARAEADASNARAESLSGQLSDLQSVIEETKRGMEVVRREHDEVSRAARSVEGRLIQVEGELIRAARAKKDAVEGRDLLKGRAEKSEKLARDLQDKVDSYYDEVRMLKKDLLEMEELEKVRSDRTHRIEEEYQEARARLLEASSAAAEAESTVTSLQSVIEELRRENESLHEQMNESRDNVSKDRAKQNEALTLAEREAQKWKIKWEEGEEERRKEKMDKQSAEKQVEQLKSRLANMDRRLNDSSKQSFSRTAEKTPTASSAVTPASNLGMLSSFNSQASVVSDASNKRKYVDELPRRESASKAAPNSSSRQLSYQKENKSNANLQDHLGSSSASIYGAPKRKVARSNRCCLCSKEGGMILSCQCGEIKCQKRAHAICIGSFRSSGKNGNSTRTILCKEI